MADRSTVCFPRWGTQDVVKRGDEGFQKELDRWYSAEESKALEALIEMKNRLRAVRPDEFWSVAVEGISNVVGSEIAFVMKRMLVDDQNTAVEMPPLGEPGSCLMAAALHYCTSAGDKHTVKENKFHAYACPCAYMRHDKIFVIPEELDGFITNNPNQMPIATDAYMAVPIFAEGKCIAHFGVMWTKKSSPKHRFSWAFVECLLHSLEDIITQKLLDGSNFLQTSKTSQSSESTEAAASAAVPVTPAPQRVIPHDAISVAQSLRPYAGSLSHELRTPMQGVVGMLDVMYATVQEAFQFQDDPHLKKVFQNLKESIEIVQDSSRRAVVAADNVVHAYDMNMSIPDSISPLQDIADPFESRQQQQQKPGIVVEGQEIPMARASIKRRRDLDEDADEDNDTPSKQAKFENLATTWAARPEASQEIKAGLQEAENMHSEDRDLRQVTASKATHNHNHHHHHHHHNHHYHPHSADSLHEVRHSPVLRPVRRAANIRAVLQYVINEGLKTGGRPDFVSSLPMEHGEVIEVRSRGSDGTVSQKHIRWTVDSSIPKTMNYDEKDFSKLVSCVVLNAIKFTDGINGKISVRAQLNLQGQRHLSIRISDNGPGIPADFLPKLFKPFSQENGSLTRQSDGLGLGLMVAKGIARKMGGDLTCTRAETGASTHGCEFEVTLPVNSGDVICRSRSPSSPPITQERGNDAHTLSRDAERLQSPAPLATTELVPDAPPPRRGSEYVREEIVSNLDTINNLPNGNPAASTTTTASSTLSPLSPSSLTTPVATKRPPLNKLSRSNYNLTRSSSTFEIDRELAHKYPLHFLVAEDNKINRKLLVSMLSKLGYRNVLEAHDGLEAVRQMSLQAAANVKIDVVLMDLWMPIMDGYEATEKILGMNWGGLSPTVLAVTADVTDGALEKAAQVGMRGFMSKPYKLQDLQRLITEYCLGCLDESSESIAGIKDDIPTALTQTAIIA